MPKRLDGLRFSTLIEGRPVEVCYHIRGSVCSPKRLLINDRELRDPQRFPNPYRPGGIVVDLASLLPLLDASKVNRVDVWL
jgi:hypothetical protein